MVDAVSWNMNKPITGNIADWFGGKRILDKEVDHFDPFAGVFDPAKDTGTRNIRYGVGFCGENFLTPVNLVSEIVQNPVIFRLPNTPNWVRGVINLRGNVVPVIDLDAHPDYKTAEISDARTLIVINRGEAAMGLFIDRYPVMLDFDGEDVSEMSGSEFVSKVAGEYILSTTKVGESIYYEIDYASFFLELTHAYFNQFKQ